MAEQAREVRPKTVGDTEKLTVNLGYVDLGHIDLLVQDVFYSNRTDFIRTAIRNQIEKHADTAKRSVAHKRLDLGVRHFSRADLEAARAAGQPTVPSTLAEEAATNPFLRADDPALQAASGMEGRPPAEVFAAIRKAKDNF